jgi:hypothetical protein
MSIPRWKFRCPVENGDTQVKMSIPRWKCQYPSKKVDAQLKMSKPRRKCLYPGENVEAWEPHFVNVSRGPGFYGNQCAAIKALSFADAKFCWEVLRTRSKYLKLKNTRRGKTIQWNWRQGCQMVYF